ncbi:putative ABC transporter permease protein [compost metagenome]
MVPHLGRMICGADNRSMMPVAAMLGAVFMLVIDVAARTATSAELPIGVLTGLIGAPFYFYLLMNDRRHIR